MNAIETRDLKKLYRLDLLRGRRTVVALDSLTLDVPEGQVFGMLGPNGAGKSTTIKLLLNLIRPTSGTARLFGRDPAEAEARRAVGYLPENPAPYEYLTGREFVTLSAQLAGITGREVKPRVDEVLAQVQMEAFANVQIRRYSKGMTQRISLAQAMVARPRLLILDEPTSGLDVLGRQVIRDLILQERQRGTTVVLCSHIIPDVEALAQHVAIIIGGKLVKSGPVNELLSASSTQVEIVLDGATAELEPALTELSERCSRVGQRLTVWCEATKSRAIIEAAYARGASVTTVQPRRYSLEETFLDALRRSGRSIGGEVS